MNYNLELDSKIEKINPITDIEIAKFLTIHTQTTLPLTVPYALCV